MNKIDAISAVTAPASNASYSSRVNLQWVRLVAILDMNVLYRHGLGVKLFTGPARALWARWFRIFTGVAPGVFALGGS